MDAIDAFKNEREYFAATGNHKTTVAAMDWALGQIMRLREMHSNGVAMLDKAAAECVRLKDEIERLTRERDKLEGVLHKIAEMPDEDNEWDGSDKFREARDLARTVLAYEQSGTK